MIQTYPRKSLLWSGAILGGIVNAVMTAMTPSYAYAAEWSGNQYGLNGCDGREGVIAFEGGPWSCEGRLVGVFYDVHMVRQVFHSTDEECNLEPLFSGCPSFQRLLAEKKALPYLRLEVRGRAVPRVTAVFWDEGEFLNAAVPWHAALANGADLIENELIEDIEVALLAWQENYGMTEEQVKFVRSVFERKIARPAATLELKREETAWLASTSEDPREKAQAIARLYREKTGKGTDLTWLNSIDPEAEYKKAMALCREKLGAIGILLPESA